MILFFKGVISIVFFGTKMCDGGDEGVQGTGWTWIAMGTEDDPIFGPCEFVRTLSPTRGLTVDVWPFGRRTIPEQALGVSGIFVGTTTQLRTVGLMPPSRQGQELLRAVVRDMYSITEAPQHGTGAIGRPCPLEPVDADELLRAAKIDKYVHVQVSQSVLKPSTVGLVYAFNARASRYTCMGLSCS